MAEKQVMKSNLAALKEAWAKKSQKSGFKFWKPIEDGRYTVRFLPPKTSNGLFYKEVAQHRVGESYYFCPKIEGDRCPICEYYKGLYDAGKDDGIALAKEIKPRKQYMYNIVVRDENGKTPEDPDKVNVYMSGKILYDTLMDYFFDDDYGDLTDVEKGYDFQIVKEQGDLGWPTYKKSKPRKTSSPLSEDEDTIEKILSNVRDLDKEVEYKSYDELKAILTSFLDQKKGVFGQPASKVSNDDDDDVPVRKAPKDADDMDAFEAELINSLGSK